jgi:glycosyltransferase involved in cell wall biosynthesis
MAKAPAAPRLVGKRILMIVENLPVPFDRRVWLEAQSLHAAGAEVTVICPRGRGYEAPYEIRQGITIHRHPLPISGSGSSGYFWEYAIAMFWQFVLTTRIFFRQGIDVIHACNPPDLICVVAAPFRLFGVKFLFDHHDLVPELYEAKFNKRGLLWYCLGWFERATFALASVSLATNESYYRIATTRGGMAPEDVFVVRSAPDLSRFKPVPPVARWKNDRQYLIGYLGILGEQEGVDLLLEAIYHLVTEEKRRDIQVVIIGDGPHLPFLRSLSNQLELTPYVTFTGRVADEVLVEALSTADICVNPDRVTALNDLSTMNKVMEYMALGKPIVQFAVTEGRVSAGTASLYAKANNPKDFAKKITALLDDEKRRSVLGARGQKRILTKLNWPNSEKQLLAAYSRLFGLDKA